MDGVILGYIAKPHGENSVCLVPVYRTETRPIGKIGCDDCIGSLDAVDTFTIGRCDADTGTGPIKIDSENKKL